MIIRTKFDVGDEVYTFEEEIEEIEERCSICENDSKGFIFIKGKKFPCPECVRWHNKPGFVRKDITKRIAIGPFKIMSVWSLLKHSKGDHALVTYAVDGKGRKNFRARESGLYYTKQEAEKGMNNEI